MKLKCLRRVNAFITADKLPPQNISCKFHDCQISGCQITKSSNTCRIWSKYCRMTWVENSGKLHHWPGTSKEGFPLSGSTPGTQCFSRGDVDSSSPNRTTKPVTHQQHYVALFFLANCWMFACETCQSVWGAPLWLVNEAQMENLCDGENRQSCVVGMWLFKEQEEQLRAKRW